MQWEACRKMLNPLLSLLPTHNRGFIVHGYPNAPQRGLEVEFCNFRDRLWLATVMYKYNGV